MSEQNESTSTALRLPAGMLAEVDHMVERLRGSVVAAASGRRWGRASAMRLALARGLAELTRELDAADDAEAAGAAK